MAGSYNSALLTNALLPERPPATKTLPLSRIIQERENLRRKLVAGIRDKNILAIFVVQPCAADGGGYNSHPHSPGFQNFAPDADAKPQRDDINRGGRHVRPDVRHEARDMYSGDGREAHDRRGRMAARRKFTPMSPAPMARRISHLMARAS